MIWKVIAAVRSGHGKIHSDNEDSYFFNGYFPSLDRMNAEAEKTGKFPCQGAMFAVCDGVGGRSMGEMASHTAVSGMISLQRYISGRDFKKTLQSWVSQADQVIHQRTNGGGTTLALLYFQENDICYGHIGDSRIYRYHENQLTRLTRDHSRMEYLLSEGLIQPEEVRTHPDRHVITRCLGMNSDEFICEATIGESQPMVEGDRYLLCSDGITDMLEDSEIAQCLAPDRMETPLACARELYRRAMEKGGLDNLTAIVLDVSQVDDMSDGIAQADEAPVVGGQDESTSRTVNLSDKYEKTVEI